MPRKVLLLAAIFEASGLAKVGGTGLMRQSFAKWGYSPHFRILTGLFEIAAGALLLSSASRRAAAVGLEALMLGAAYTHLSTPGERSRVLIPLATIYALRAVETSSRDASIRRIAA